MSTKKLEIGVIISIIGLALTLVTSLIAYGGHEATQSNTIESIQREMARRAPKVDKVDVIENDIKHIKVGVEEIKQDMKELLRRTP